MAKTKYKKLISEAPQPSSSESTRDSIRFKETFMRKNNGRTIVLLTSLAGILVGVDGLLRFHKHACGGTMDGVWDALDQAGVFDYAHLSFAPQPAQALCPQADELYPEKNKLLWDAVGIQLGSDEFKEQTIAWLGDAIRIP